MITRDAVLRRIGLWAAVVTGVALVGSQFACIKPQSLLAAPGFPHASRSAGAPSAATRVNLPAEEMGMAWRAPLFWTLPRSARNEVAPTRPMKERSEGSTHTKSTE